jgi:Uma2 family endonuclease
MMKSPVMAPRHLDDPASTERNSPSVEAAFQAAPEELVAELLDGELHLSPRPARPHARVASLLGGMLIAPFWLGRGGPGGWIILDEPELHLGPRPDKLVPELAGWRRERLPDAGGVDPLARTLDVFRLQGGDWLLLHAFSAEERVRAEPFDAMEFELALLWSE